MKQIICRDKEWLLKVLNNDSTEIVKKQVAAHEQQCGICASQKVTR